MVLKVEKSEMLNDIVKTEYHNVSPRMIVCTVTVKCGFVFTGMSSCLDDKIFDETIGKQIAYENAIESMWQCYGFYKMKTEGGDFKYRLFNEYDDLRERTHKLESFLASSGRDVLPVEQTELLVEQLVAMKRYLYILENRISKLA